jgi:hypothetical protein
LDDNLRSFIEREDIPISEKIETLYKYRENGILEEYFWLGDDEREEEEEAIVKEFAERGVAWAQDFLES